MDPYQEAWARHQATVEAEKEKARAAAAKKYEEEQAAKARRAQEIAPVARKVLNIFLEKGTARILLDKEDGIAKSTRGYDVYNSESSDDERELQAQLDDELNRHGLRAKVYTRYITSGGVYGDEYTLQTVEIEQIPDAPPVRPRAVVEPGSQSVDTSDEPDDANGE